VKKTLSVILAILMLTMLVSCNLSGSHGTSSGTPTAPESTPNEPSVTDPAPKPTDPLPTEPPETEPQPEPSTLSICGVDISQYIIVYPQANELGEKALAEQLAEHIKNEFKFEIPVVSDENEATTYEILVGTTNATHLSEFKIAKAQAFEKYRVDAYHSTVITVDGSLLVSGNNTETLTIGINKLISCISPSEPGSKIDIDFSDNDTIINASVFAGDAITVMSYNIYTNNPSTFRGKQLYANISSYDPDVIGVQELNSLWIKLFKKYTDLFDTYEMVGKPRMDEKDTSNGNEYSAIFFKKDKFNLIETKTYWLSDTPEKISKYSDTEYYRIMTYAVLERKSDGEKFIHVNTHLATEKAVRQKQIAVLLELASGLIETHGNLPMYFTGDYNMTPSDPGYASMINWGNGDARELSGTNNTSSTCGKSIIDYCFIYNDSFHVTDFDVGYGLEGSDHYLVYTELYMK